MLEGLCFVRLAFQAFTLVKELCYSRRQFVPTSVIWRCNDIYTANISVVNL